ICSRGSSTRVKRTRRRRRKTRTPTTSRTTTSTRTTTRTSTMMTMIGTTTTTTTKRRKGRRRLAPRGAEPADGVRGHRKRAGREAPEHWTVPRGRYLERGALRPRHRHARDLERRRRDRVSRTDVAPHHLDVAQHVA